MCFRKDPTISINFFFTLALNFIDRIPSFKLPLKAFQLQYLYEMQLFRANKALEITFNKCSHKRFHLILHSARECLNQWWCNLFYPIKSVQPWECPHCSVSLKLYIVLVIRTLYTNQLYDPHIFCSKSIYFFSRRALTEEK